MGRGPALMAPRRPARGSGDLPIDRDPSRIEAMFGDIAARYDLMNRLMTVGLDGRWRRMAAGQARLAPGDEALDACCGTGDLTFSLVETCPACAVTGLDFTPEMLERAREKAATRQGRGLPVPREFVAGDLLALPFADGRFAAVTVGWGVRNVPDVPRAFARWRASRGPAGASCASSPRRRRTARASASTTSGWAASCRCSAGSSPATPRPTRTCPPRSRRSRAPTSWRPSWPAPGSTNVRYRRFGFGAVALHVGEVPA